MDKRVSIFLAVLTVLVAAVSCGDSDDTPLGSEFIGDLLGSVPGEVFQDSIEIAGSDTVYTFYRPIDKQPWFEVGIQDDYERIMLLKGDFSGAGGDTLLTVLSATLRLTYDEFTDYVNQIRALFYELGTEYTEGDSVVTVDTTAVIPDPDTGARVRQLSEGVLAYDLPPDLVQRWIRGEAAHNGIAVVYADNGSNELMGFESREGEKVPSILVNFVGGTSTNYPVSDDCTVARPLAETDNLVISDGYVRRVYFRIDLSQVNDSAAVHGARLLFKVVDGSTTFETGQTVEIYIPKSSDPASSDFLSPLWSDRELLDPDAGELEFSLTIPLLAVLAGDLADNGYVLKFTGERTEVRQVEFYPGGDVQRRPKLYITYSTPARFER